MWCQRANDHDATQFVMSTAQESRRRWEVCRVTTRPTCAPGRPRGIGERAEVHTQPEELKRGRAEASGFEGVRRIQLSSNFNPRNHETPHRFFALPSFCLICFCVAIFCCTTFRYFSLN